MLLLVAALSTATIAAIRREAMLRQTIEDARAATSDARRATREARCSVVCLAEAWWSVELYDRCVEGCG